MELIKPDIGLLFWMCVSFLIVLAVLGKFAWKPILKALKDREESIETSLSQARKAREEMALLRLEQDKLREQAQAERERILSEGRDACNAIIAEAKKKARDETERMKQAAHDEIQSGKRAAIAEIKHQVAALSVEIAEKILKNELSEEKKQKTLIKNLLEEIQLN